MKRINIIEILAVYSIFIMGFILSFFTINKIGIWDQDATILISFNRLLIHEKTIRIDFFIKGFYTPPLPFFLLFGLTKFALRFSQAIFSAATIFLTFSFTKEFFSKKTAIFASLMLSTFPFYILYDGGETPFLPFFTMVSLLFFWRFYRSEDSKNLYLACLLIGYAITIKLSFIYLIISLFVSFLLISHIFKNKIKLKKSQITKALLFLFIGASPLIFANILYNFPTIKEIKENFITTQSGWENFNVLRGLEINWFYFKMLFEVPTFNIHLPDNYLNTVRYKFSFGLFFISFFYLCLQKERKDYFIIFILIFYCLLIQFVPTAPHPEHFYLVFPLFLIIMARALTSINSKWMYFLLILFLLFNLITIFEVNQLLNDEKKIEKNLPYYAKYHSLVPKYVENGSTIVTPFIWQAEYISNLYPEKNIITLPFVDMCKPGYCYHIAEPEKIRIVLNGTLNESDVLYILPSQYRKTLEDRRAYLHSCLVNDPEKNLCDVSFNLLQNVSLARNKTLDLKYMINDTSGRPVYEIFSVI